jgi:CRISPR-associated protein Cas1
MTRTVVIQSAKGISVKNRQLVISEMDFPTATIPIEDIALIILESHGIRLTNEVLVQCAENNIVVVACDAKHMPVALLQPLESHSLHTKVLRHQINASIPVNKRIWQQLIQHKTTNQFLLLKHHGRKYRDLEPFVSQVLSGDSTFIEAKVARLYFNRLYGPGFVRDREQEGINSMLNYGYAIVRAMTARAIVGTGLHPALGVQHHNQYNPFCLADDVMEPLRPLVDNVVYTLKDTTDCDNFILTPNIKRNLLSLTDCTVKCAGKNFPLVTALERCVTSIKAVLIGEKRKIDQIQICY